MNPKPKTANADDMLLEYDFSNAVRGKYYERYSQDTNVVRLDPDVAEAFPNATAVNDALRLLVAVADANASRRQERAQRPNKALRPTSPAQRKDKRAATSKAARG
jgi:hypothetical protein